MWSENWVRKILSTKKAKHLIDALADRDVLEEAADDSLQSVGFKSITKGMLLGKEEPNDIQKAQLKKIPWYVKKFILNREQCIDELQNMVILQLAIPMKYNEVILHAIDKDREIYPTHFYPWSVLFHGIKLLLEPISEKVAIYDSSAGRKGKGQTFGVLRVKSFMRRYKDFHAFWKGDFRKFYLSIPHEVIMMVMRQHISDELFLDFFEKNVLNFCSDITDLLHEEIEKKKRYCHWASDVPFHEYEKRGITTGSPISQIIGNMVNTIIDRRMKEVYKAKGYHRHCDDTIGLARTVEEGFSFLNKLDGVCNELGIVLKASSFSAPLKDEKFNIEGRGADIMGFVFSRRNCRMRKRNKVHFATAIARVKSRKRRQEILAAYWGIVKWGRCRHLWHTITNRNYMAFRDFGIQGNEEITMLDGKRCFNVQSTSQGTIANMPISVIDFEDGLNIKGKTGRCSVLIETSDGRKMKFITSSSEMISQLNKGRELEANGTKFFPQPTVVRYKSLGGNKGTYYLE